MAAIAVHEVWDGREGSQVLDGRKREYSRVFEVTTDNPADGPVSAMANAAVTLGIPLFGSSHPEDAGAVVSEITPTQDSESPTRWTVRVRYSSDLKAPDAVQPGDPSDGGGAPPGSENAPGDRPENPLARPPMWKFAFQQTQEAFRTGYKYDLVTGAPLVGSVDILNSAGLPFDPPVTVEVSRPLVTVTVNRSRWSLPRAVDLIDSVNLKAWQGCNPRVVRCIGVDAESAFENGISYWRITYQFALKYDTWDLRVLDAGYMERDYSGESNGGVTKLKKIMDEWGREASDPVPLNGNGRRLPVGDTPIYKVFQVYRQRDFSKLVI